MAGLGVSLGLSALGDELLGDERTDMLLEQVSNLSENFTADSPRLAGQDKRAKFPTSKAPLSAVSRSFRLIFGRAIISRNGLEAWMLFPKRARAEHSC